MRRWRTLKKRGQCYYTPGCQRPAPNGRYCAHHQARALECQKVARHARQQLGFCTFCTERAAPGFVRCSAHLVASKQANKNRRDKLSKVRGWKLVMVKA